MINKELKEYIKNNIFPEYNKNDEGHNLDHIKYIIETIKPIIIARPPSLGMAP